MQITCREFNLNFMGSEWNCIWRNYLKRNLKGAICYFFPPYKTVGIGNGVKVCRLFFIVFFLFILLMEMERRKCLKLPQNGSESYYLGGGHVSMWLLLVWLSPFLRSFFFYSISVLNFVRFFYSLFSFIGFTLSKKKHTTISNLLHTQSNFFSINTNNWLFGHVTHTHWSTLDSIE